MPWTDLIYLSERRAQEIGFTHHGSIYGVPAWMAERSDNEVVACPKFTVLQLYAMAADWFFARWVEFVPGDYTLITPMTFGAEIPRVEAI